LHLDQSSRALAGLWPPRRLDKQIAATLMERAKRIHPQLDTTAASTIDSCRLEMRCHMNGPDPNDHASKDRPQRMHTHINARMKPGMARFHGNAIGLGILASYLTANITLDVNAREGVIVFWRSDRS